jgi:hypothetical protein
MIKIKNFFSFGANSLFVFGNAIPALAFISSLRCEDIGMVGANGKLVLLSFIFWS